MKFLCLIISLFFLQNVTVNAQAKKKKYVGYFVTQTGDTTFCRILRYGQNSQGSLNKLIYVDINGKKADLKGKKDIPYINTFYLGGKFYDRVELNVDKPGSYYRYAERIADGKIVFYKLYQESTSYDQNPTSGKWESNDSEKTTYWIRSEDGTLTRAYKPKNLLEDLMPEMLKCAEFAKKYKKANEVDEFAVKKAINLYNTSCK